MKDWISERDDDFFNLQAKVVNKTVVRKTAWVIPDARVDALVARRAEYEPLYLKSQEKGERTRGDISRHRNIRKIYEKELRNFAKEYLMFNSNVSRDERVEMGLTDPDTQPTPTAPDYVINLDAPALLLDWSHRGYVIVHFGVEPANEKRNAKPKDIAGVKIWYRIESGPWIYVADDTNSPYMHNLGLTEPTNVEYRAQWFDKKGRTGSYSETAKCTVSP